MAEVALFSHLKNNLESQHSRAEPDKTLFTHISLYEPRTFVITPHVLIEILHLKSSAFSILSVLQETFDGYLFRTTPQMSQNDNPDYKQSVQFCVSSLQCTTLSHAAQCSRDDDAYGLCLFLVNCCL